MTSFAVAANGRGLPECRNGIPAAGLRRNFLIHGAVLKLNRITKAEKLFCRLHFGNAIVSRNADRCFSVLLAVVRYQVCQ
jgi:hypothetical protein